jgi:leucyl-tRNA---protein transferase
MTGPLSASLQTVQFYTTAEYACSYLPEKMARSQVASPSHLIHTDAYTRLVHLGFRRSGLFTYRPKCDACQACQSMRIPVAEFVPNRSQKRCWARFKHLAVRALPLEHDEVHHRLYLRYQEMRHAGSDMQADDAQQYAQFLLQSHVQTQLLEFSSEAYVTDLNPRGVCMVSVMDVLGDGLSAVYTFFEPEETQGLGTYAVLWQIAHAKARGLPHVYLGYWIDNSRKMHYKRHFQPGQVLKDGVWQTLA